MDGKRAGTGRRAGPARSRGHGHRPPVVGLTGNIGSGKSTVARLLAERGAVVIDSDSLAREAVEDPVVLQRIAAELGADLVHGGSLDRARTARLVFGDEAARRRLEGIIHPWVRERGRQLQEELLGSEDPPPLIVHDIPLLFENGLESQVDGVIVVSAPAELRAQRVMARNGLSPEEFEARDRAQMPLEEKAARATWLLDNSGDLASLEAQVAALWSELTG